MEFTKEELEEKVYHFQEKVGGHGETFAMFIRQPYADIISTGEKSIEIRSKWTSYRGDVLICSTQKHDYPNYQGGCCVGLAELYDIKPVSSLTDDEWKKTRVGRRHWNKIKDGWAWMFRNQRRIVEFPCRSKNKIAWINFIRDDIFVYPKYVIYDRPLESL